MTIPFGATIMPLTSYDDQLLSPLLNIRDSVPESGPFCAGGTELF